MQHRNLEALHMEVETRHKNELRRLRAELALAETRQANDEALSELDAMRGSRGNAADQQLTSAGTSTTALREAQAFALAAAELLREEDLEDSLEEFALAAAELL